ncbi:threonine--tRNA ligase [Lachnospira multipara]|uniref:threonine--tRNA ligase n=1 Tax=Lachnospira multipara TaxID=28051 RepID=UPI0004E1EEC6|nr:threonine--tRNA ligase [Lachnospira multipara]
MVKEEYLEVYRHSLAHVLAKAVMEIFGKENVQIAIGPQIADGFYYDFILPRTVTKEDYKTIENKMTEILKRKEDFTVKEVSKEEALKLFADQKFKVELINDLPEGEKITVYNTGDDFYDLCRGPHVPNSQELLSASFEIKSVSGAYWRGDEHRDMLQRIYVYAFPDKQQLKEHKKLIQEALERDHKKIGPALDLFMFDETAPGMPYWLPRGWKMFNALLDYWRGIHDKKGYEEIAAPVVNSTVLWKTSGHWAHYKNNMFLMYNEDADDDTDPDDIFKFALKPMNCPNAMMVYKRKQHSYKDLPIRYNETDLVHRKEKSGQLNGLFRVQLFRQDDCHLFVTEDQIGSEIKNIMSIANDIYNTFGLTYRVELSTRPDDFMGDINVWNKAEESLKNVLNEMFGEGGYEINEGDGAFYGPKIDLKMKDCLGREWQTGTIQLDFQLPKNFELKYVAADGSMKQPVVLHRAIFGSFERFFGIITENFKGAFPFWLSPYQVGVVPILPEHNEYAKEVADLLDKAGVRVEANYSDNNMNSKIKTFKNFKDPYIIVIGDKEVAERTVSINIRGTNKKLNNVPLEKFIEMCKKMNETHCLDVIDTLE